MNGSIFILKGNIVYSKSQTEFAICEHGYLVCRDGKVDGIYRTLPFRLGGNPIRDYGDCLIIPGLVDLHVHAPQYSYRGLGMDMELLEWLEVNTFPEEAKFEETDYAKKSTGSLWTILRTARQREPVSLPRCTALLHFFSWICLRRADLTPMWAK